MSDLLDEVCAMSIYNPRREKLVQVLMHDQHLYDDDVRFQALKKENQAAELSYVFIHQFALEHDSCSSCDFPEVIKVRKMLQGFFSDLKVCSCIGLETIADNAIRCIQENSEDFWRWHSYLIYFLMNNEVKAADCMDLCKKCLVVEDSFCKKVRQMGGELKEILHFGAYNSGGKNPFGVENVTAYFLKKDRINSLFAEKQEKSILLEKLLLANRFAGSLQVDEVFTLWHKDRECIKAFGNETVAKCISSIEDYFITVGDAEVCCDYLDVSLNVVLNRASVGEGLSSIKADVEKVKSDLSIFPVYSEEVKKAFDFAFKEISYLQEGEN